jgi:autotransporter-associated beta strand protein
MKSPICETNLKRMIFAVAAFSGIMASVQATEHLYWDTNDRPGLQAFDTPYPMEWGGNEKNWNTEADGTSTRVAWKNGAIAHFGESENLEVHISDKVSPAAIYVDSGKCIIGGGAIKAGKTLRVAVKQNAVCEIKAPIVSDEIVVDGLGTLTISGEHQYAGAIVLNEGRLIIASEKSLDTTKCKIRPSYGVIVAFRYPIAQRDIDMISSDMAPAFTLALASDSPHNLDFSANAGLAGTSLGALGYSTYSGKLTPYNSQYRLGGGGGTLKIDGMFDDSGTLIVGGFFAPSGIRIYWQAKDWSNQQPSFSGTVILPASAKIPDSLVIQNGILKVGAKTVPPTPVNLSLERVSSDTVKLSWLNGESSMATSVEIAEEGKPFAVKTLLSRGENSCTVANLAHGRKFQFRVIGVNEDLKSRPSNVVTADTTPLNLTAPELLSAVGSCTWVDLEWKNTSQGYGSLIQQSADGKTFHDAKSIPPGLARGYVHIPETRKSYFRIATLDADRKPGPWSNVLSAETDAKADIEKELRHRFQLDDGSRVFNPDNPAVTPAYTADEKEAQRLRGDALIQDFKKRIASDTTYEIPAGIYRVKGGLMNLERLQNVTVKAVGVTFIMDDANGKSNALFNISSCRNISFEGPMVLTQDIPKYSVARIVKTDMKNKTVDLDVLPGYSINLIEKGDWYPFDEKGLMLNENQHNGVKKLGERLLQLQNTVWPAGAKHFAAVSAADIPGYGAFGVSGQPGRINENLVFKDVTCYGFGAPADRVKGYVKYINYRVLPQPGTSQLFCSWPGQFGYRDSAFIFDGCEFNTGGDDGINLLSRSGMAAGQVGPRAVTLFIIKPEIGELLRFYNFRTLAFLGEARVESVETFTTANLLAEGNNWLKTNRTGRSDFKDACLVKLDRDVRIGWYAQVYAPENGASDLIVRNCYWRDMFAQAVLAQTCRQGMIVNNLFERSTLQAIHLTASTYWMEGYWPRNVAIRNNVVRDNSSIPNRFASSSIEIGCVPAVPWGTLGLIENCDIEGNRIFNSAYSAVRVNYGKDCRVIRNTIVNPGVIGGSSAAIEISGGENIVISDNEIRFGESKCNSWLKFSPDVRRENIHFGGNRVFDAEGHEIHPSIP